MLMNKSLLFYILSMVGRQQARNGRKANLFIPQIRKYTSRRTKCSQHCQGPGHNPPSPGGSHRSWSHGDAPGWSLRSSSSQNPLGFVSNFPCEHQTSNTITVQQVLMLSGEQGRIIGKIRGVFVWYSVRERCRGDGRGGHSCRPQHKDREWCSIRREKHLELAEVALWSSPEELCQSPRSRSCAGRGAERTGSCRARGLAHTALPWLLALSIYCTGLAVVMCIFAVWWLILPL